MSTAQRSAPPNTATATLAFEKMRAIVLALFFVSGASALIYEVAWVRLLSLAFGVSVYAVSAVLSAFMGGLALGAWLIGRLGGREGATGAALLRLYAMLQLGIALCALLSPLIVSLITGLYASLDQTSALSAAVSAALRFGLAIVALLVPTTLMGGTLPVMAQLLARGERERGRALGELYAANTFGAVVGTLLAGLVLIRFLGTAGAIMVAAAGDLATVAVAWWMAQGGVAERRAPGADPSEPPRREQATLRVASREQARDARAPRSRRAAPTSLQAPAADTAQAAHTAPQITSAQARVVLIGFALSGFASLAYQVVWTRILAIFSLNAVFSFSVMLATFLTGLAVGGAIIARRADRTAAPTQLFGALQLAIGVSAVLTLFVFSRLYTILNALTLPDTLGGVIWAELLAAAATMLIPTLLIGATFPVAARVYTGGGADVGRRIGRLYACNTLGAMLGSLAAGFLLIPALGLQRAALALAAINLIIGAAALLAARPPARRAIAGVAGAVAAATAGALLLPPGIYLGFREDVIPALKYYREGVDATVAVFEIDTPPLKVSFVNGRNEVPTDPQSMRAFYMLGHLPPLLRPDAERALVVSFGNGVATGSLAQHPLAQITAVELVDGQVEAARLLYTAENRGVLDDPRLRIVHEDGRNFLLRDRGSYDIITADATHPINSSSWALFTREFYSLVQARLAPGGVFIQWLPFHDLATEDYRSIVRTFQSVFPNTTLFYTGGIHTFLVATPEPLTRAEILALESRLQGTAAGQDLGGAQQLAGDLLLDADGVARYAATAQVISDDRAFFLPAKDEGDILRSFAPYALR